MLNFKKIALIFAAILMSVTSFNNYAQTIDEDDDIFLTPVEKNGKYGFEDSDENLVIPCKYYYAGDFY